jgi:F-type H+-transporting ATPase subunit a
MHVSLTAEKIFDLGPLPVTNALLTTWLVIALVIIFAVIFRLRLRKSPSGMQNIVETIIEGFHGIIESVTENVKQARQFFAIIFTIFLFVLLNNWSGLIPGVGSVGIIHEVAHAEEPHDIHDSNEANTKQDHSEKTENHTTLTPIFRAGTADLSFTLALAAVSVFLVQIIGVRALGGWKYFSRFFQFKNPINFFVGLLELISEFSKMISFSFRLFGNVFAGEVLLTVIIALAPFVVPIPFYGLEIFVGLVQALVFSILTLVFFKMATTDGH